MTLSGAYKSASHAVSIIISLLKIVELNFQDCTLHLLPSASSFVSNCMMSSKGKNKRDASGKTTARKGLMAVAVTSDRSPNTEEETSQHGDEANCQQMLQGQPNKSAGTGACRMSLKKQCCMTRAKEGRRTRARMMLCGGSKLRRWEFP